MGEVTAIAVETGLIAVGQTADEVVGTYEFGCLYALLVGGVEFTVADIVEHGAREEVGLLKHDAHRFAKALLRDVGNGDAVVEDMALLDLVETVDEVDDGGLSGTRAAHKGDLLAGVSVDVDVVEHLLIRRIAKINIGEIDIAFGILQDSLALIDLRLGIHQTEDALGSDGGIEHRVNLL